MRISRITVKDLFGLFNYTIKLHTGMRITIIHGPNGCGKTTILKLLDALFHGKFNVLRRVYFQQISVTFLDGTELRVARTSEPETTHPEPLPPEIPHHSTSLSIQYITKAKAPEHYELPDPLAKGPEVQRVFAHLDRYLPFLHRTGSNEWFDSHDSTSLAFDEVLDRYAAHLPIPVRAGRSPPPPWFTQLTASTDIHFIQTQRLLRFGHRTEPRNAETPTHRVTVAEYAEDFVTRVQNALAASVNQAQDLDRTFPIRVFNEPHEDITLEAVRTLYESQQEKRKRLTQASLITQQMGIMNLPERQLEAVERRLLWLYLSDVDKKLNVFDELLAKIEVFREILNSRFLHKTFTPDRERGFVFRASNDQDIPPNALSSGEQHELILAYELLFRVKKSSLILIDEPELSLHVTWQHKFLDDLKRISDLAQLDFVIATHSPQIIHNRSDLAVALAGDVE